MALLQGMKGLFILAFLTTVGILLLVLSCALPQYGNFYPLFVLLTYFLAPLPSMINRRINYDSYNDGAGADVALFCTTALVVSGFGIPLVLWHAGEIAVGACFLTFGGNALVFAMLLGFFKFYQNDEDSW